VPNTFIKIASVTVGSGGASTISFTSIPSTFTDLCLKISSRESGGAGLNFTFNGVTTGYNDIELYTNNGTSAASYARSGNAGFWGIDNSSSTTANTFGNSQIYIPNYAGSTNKSYSADGVAENNAPTSWMALDAGLWSNTAAITSIGLSPITGTLWNQYSTAYLFGIKSS
jgi:hypothetical protein